MCDSVPLFLIDAARQGTGKGLLNDIVHIIWTGEPAEVSDLPLNAEEQRKSLTTHLRNAPLSVTFDDISLLSGHAIQRAITASTWRDRILGRNEECALPVRCIWAATANNAVLGGDMVRRVVLIRLESHEENPSQRTDLKRSESDLRAFVREHRRELVSACITLIQHGLAHGTPGNVKMGGFGRFARTVSTILNGIGVEGFYENMAATFEREDSRQTGWKAIVHAWYEEYGTGLVRARDIAKLIEEDSECDIWLEGESDKARDTAAGKLLKQRVGAVFAVEGKRLQIDKTADNKGKARYRLKELNFSPGQPPPRKKLPAGWRINHAGDGSGVVVAPDGTTHMYLGNEPDGIKLARKLAAAALWATRRRRGEPEAEPPEPTPDGGAPADLSNGGGGDIPHCEALAPHSPHSPHICTGSITRARARAQEKTQSPYVDYVGYVGGAHQEAKNALLELPIEPAALAELVREALQPPPDYEAARQIAAHALNGQRAELLSEIAAAEQALSEPPPHTHQITAVCSEEDGRWYLVDGEDMPVVAYSFSDSAAAEHYYHNVYMKEHAPAPAAPDTSEDAATIAATLDSSGIPAGWQWDTARPYTLVNKESGQRTSMDTDTARVIVEALSIALQWQLKRASAAYEAYQQRERTEE
jgi:hypothetical protein